MNLKDALFLCKKGIPTIALISAALLAVLLAGCSEGPSASNDQLIQARDAQAKAMAQSHSPTDRAQGSADGAAKVSGAPTGTK